VKCAAYLTRSIEAGAELPTEFRLFAIGSNDSTKGPALWDEQAAALTMARAKERAGVRYPIDLEHRSLDDTARALTTSATDAMGYFDIAARGGELWAVNVAWSDEGAERLRTKKQVYFSPAFYTDDKGRVIELVNVALTSMPATHGLAPLVAASRTAKSRVKTPAHAAIFALAEKRAARYLQRCEKRARLRR
jgi:phage I-like protein